MRTLRHGVKQHPKLFYEPDFSLFASAACVHPDRHTNKPITVNNSMQLADFPPFFYLATQQHG